MPPRKRTRKQRLDPKRPPFDPWKGPAEDLEELFERTRQLAGIHDGLLAEYRNNLAQVWGWIRAHQGRLDALRIGQVLIWIVLIYLVWHTW